MQASFCLRGNLLDSLLLSKLLDRLQALGARFQVESFAIGHSRKDQSRICLQVWLDDDTQEPALQALLQEFDAEPGEPEAQAAQWEPAPRDGAFPLTFYASSNRPTWVFVQGAWREVSPLGMDSAIVQREGAFFTAKFFEVRQGDLVLVGHAGVKELQAATLGKDEEFHFMDSAVSSEKPWSPTLKALAARMKAIRGKQKILLVGGPAIIHTGAAGILALLIEQGWIDLLFAGNALAAHDIEAALFGTSLGVNLVTGQPAAEGHRHHLDAINRIRLAGGIAQAVEQGILNQGVMFSCIKKGVEFVLAGSIRDDGPLPEVLTDTLQAQAAMKALIPQVGQVIFVGSLLHSIAVGNLLPALVPSVMVDINPSHVTKLADRATRAQPLVMDARAFLHELQQALA